MFPTPCVTAEQEFFNNSEAHKVRVKALPDGGKSATIYAIVLTHTCTGDTNGQTDGTGTIQYHALHVRAC